MIFQRIASLRFAAKSKPVTELCSLYSNRSSKLVNVSVDDKTGIAKIVLQSPPVNSLNLELLSEVSENLTNLEKSKCRGLILTSDCPSVFSAGLDIKEMYKPELERCKSFWTTLQEVWMKLYGSSYPTVALINGHAPAGGCLLAVSCEYRIMLPNYTIGLNETQLGIVAPQWFIASMRNVIGSRQTELALTTGNLFNSSEALKVGLVDEVCSNQDEALQKASNFFKRFQRIPPAARTHTKLVLRQKDIQNLKDNRESDLNVFLSFITQDKVQKGLELYLESLKKSK